MSNPTLTGLVFALDLALAKVPLHDPGVASALKALCDALPRYEAALTLAEAVSARDDVPDAWDRMSRKEQVSFGSYAQMVEGAEDALSAARAAYRASRS